MSQSRRKVDGFGYHARPHPLANIPRAGHLLNQRGCRIVVIQVERGVVCTRDSTQQGAVYNANHQEYRHSAGSLGCLAAYIARNSAADVCRAAYLA
jgi:hypothetical protein